ncbi:MAG TPA: hypothetical protein VKF59_21065 [Candidatus Dormibacteraeota bacterium]|nr:hypothetical protein [Candidatus Dormibacteraeota bacterium]
MRFETPREGAGEADECGCPQCRAPELPEWLWRLEEESEPAEEDGG